jgi:2-methylaconitate cis-trans-isomerase PrpF
VEHADLNDPDLQQAIADLLPMADKLRREGARLLNEQNDGYRRAITVNIRDLTSMIALRAERIGTTGPALTEILNAVLDTRARRGRKAPAGDTRRTLMTRYAEAMAQEETAKAAALAAAEAAQAAADHRAAVEAACHQFGVGRLAE